MRITTGIVGGRNILVPKSALRPTQDKVRQAFFSSLGDAIVGCRFLDLFAGSGAVGIEAWSRGAAFVCFVESDGRAIETIYRNVEDLGVPSEAIRIMKTDVARFLERPIFPKPFDFLFADPPYRKPGVRGQRSEVRSPRAEVVGRWAEKVLAGVTACSILSSRGLLVFEQGDDEPVVDVAGWGIVQERRYGAARLVFYRNLKTES